MSMISKKEAVETDAVRPTYVAPTMKEMDEKEVLSAFQVTVAGISWWVM